MENKALSSQESFEIIKRMIDHTRGKLEKGGGTIFLIWGYTSLITACAVVIALLMTGNPYWNMLWWLIPVVGWSGMYMLNRKRMKQVSTYIDRFISYIWITIGATSTILPILSMFGVRMEIIPIESIILSIGVVQTGLVIRFKPLIWCGLAAMLLACSMFFIEPYVYVFMAMFVVSMIIPGHILNYRAKCLKN